MDATATILHADLDAFYASVEQLLDPSLRGRPIAVGGGVVLAASYEAKAYGVRGGMPGRRARELCPALTFVAGHFGEYQRLGDAAIAVLGDYTPLVEELTPRELEVLQLVATGRTNPEIAKRLEISVGTAKWYTSQIYGKLEVQNRTQAVARARELGILP